MSNTNTGKQMTPKAANTFLKICKLKMDNISTRNSWLLINPDSVIVVNQRNGEESTGSVTLSKKEFERFIRFYQTGK